jgi:hypothetical protein
MSRSSARQWGSGPQESLLIVIQCRGRRVAGVADTMPPALVAIYGRSGASSGRRSVLSGDCWESYLGRQPDGTWADDPTGTELLDREPEAFVLCPNHGDGHMVRAAAATELVDHQARTTRKPLRVEIEKLV